jgi:hypothetical protein
VVVIFGIPFTVRTAIAELASHNMGQTQFDKCQITLMGDLPIERQRQVFIHEALHNLLDGEEGEDAVDEAFVRRLGNSLYEFLVTNDLLKDGWYERLLDNPPEQPVRTR